MNEEFKKICEKLDIDFADFPYDFPDGSEWQPQSIVGAMCWILERKINQTLDKTNAV